MRVIIDGIEKFPRFCGECFIMDGETCECSVPGVERTCNPYDGRYDDCPMSPLQAHGRLGDLDKLADNMRSATAGMEHRAIIMHEILRAPTVIEAEDGE